MNSLSFIAVKVLKLNFLGFLSSKVYTFALKNLRKFNLGTFNHIKDKEYVEKISF